jgi:hypothetical protein
MNPEYDPDSAYEDAHEGHYPQPPEGADDEGLLYDDSEWIAGRAELDGDFDSDMNSADHGTDEDYGYYGSDEGD